MEKRTGIGRALLISILSMLLSVSMLVGTTLAWFNDSSGSYHNIIQSGTLDVTLQWADGTQDPAAVTWKDASTDAIFDYKLWEPGYTEVRHVRIGNEGSLAIKYKLNIIATGAVSKLADVIDVYYVDPAIQVTDRTQLPEANRIGTLTEVLQNINSPVSTAVGTLEAGKADVITLALRMREDASNDYQGLAIGSEFAVQLVATQMANEDDSFDNQYDVDANAIVEIDGVKYAYTDTDIILYKVNEEYEGDTLQVIDGCTALGNYAFYYNNNVKTVILSSTVRSLGRAFDSSTVEKVVLNEGLTTIPSRAFKATAQLREVTIPSTVTTIESDAFQKTGLQNITIPESVTHIGENAFVGSGLENVTIQGKNVTFDRFAFRDCAQLKTVTILSDSITLPDNMVFVPNQNNNNPNDITIYVTSDAVAQTLRGNAHVKCNVVKVKTAATAEELTQAIAEAQDGDAILLTADIVGDVTALQKPNVDVLINGNGVSFTGTIYLHGQGEQDRPETLTFLNINFVTDKTDDFLDADSTGAVERYAHNVVVENCTFTATGEAVHNTVGLRLRQSANITVKNCYATGLHSLVQANGVKGLTVDGVTTENCKNGVSAAGDTKVTVANSTLKAEGAYGYGIRISADNNAALTVESCTIDAVVPVLVRKLSGTARVSVTGTNTFTAGNSDGYQLILTASDYDEGVALTAPTGTTELTGADDLKVHN